MGRKQPTGVGAQGQGEAAVQIVLWLREGRTLRASSRTRLVAIPHSFSWMPVVESVTQHVSGGHSYGCTPHPQSYSASGTGKKTAKVITARQGRGHGEYDVVDAVVMSMSYRIAESSSELTIRGIYEQ